VIPLFRDILKRGNQIKITDEAMTRFLLTLDDAIDLVFYATEKTTGGEIFVKKAPSTKITTIAEIISEEYGVPFKFEVIGKFPGEKLHEILITEEELDRTQDHKDFFSINPYWAESGFTDQITEYSSDEEVVDDKVIIKKLMAKADKRSEEVETDSGIFSKL
jgi:UDP-glucose 4-epimerase